MLYSSFATLICLNCDLCVHLIVCALKFGSFYKTFLPVPNMDFNGLVNSGVFRGRAVVATPPPPQICHRSQDDWHPYLVQASGCAIWYRVFFLNFCWQNSMTWWVRPSKLRVLILFLFSLYLYVNRLILSWCEVIFLKPRFTSACC